MVAVKFWRVFHHKMVQEATEARVPLQGVRDSILPVETGGVRLGEPVVEVYAVSERVKLLMFSRAVGHHFGADLLV